MRECERGRHAETFKKKIEVELYSKGRSRTKYKSSIKMFIREKDQRMGGGEENLMCILV